MTPAEFQICFDVPRGTMERLEVYARLLEWQAGMNLVGPGTLPDIWGRHFADSAQLMRHTPPGRAWLDIGAGGGFPGLVLAAMDWGRFTLVDSVGKKTRFLEAVCDELGLQPSVSIVTARVESLQTIGVDIATARATAPLATLLDWSLRHVCPGGTMLFPKGRRWAEEVAAARARFSFDVEARPSMTDPEARILVIWEVKRR